jgi:DNA-binding response OmpR family regulator
LVHGAGGAGQIVAGFSRGERRFVKSTFLETVRMIDNPQSPNSIQRPTMLVDKDFARLSVDWVRREVCHCGGPPFKLTVLEISLLACLARKAGTPVSRDEILSHVWKLDPNRTVTRTIDMHVSLLRRKLQDDADKPRLLITVYRVGYMLYSGAILLDDTRPSLRECQSGPREVIPGIESLPGVR